MPGGRVVFRTLYQSCAMFENADTLPSQLSDLIMNCCMNRLETHHVHKLDSLVLHKQHVVHLRKLEPALFVRSKGIAKKKAYFRQLSSLTRATRYILTIRCVHANILVALAESGNVHRSPWVRPRVWDLRWGALCVYFDKIKNNHMPTAVNKRGIL